MTIALPPLDGSKRCITIRLALFAGIGLLASLLVIATVQRFSDALGRFKDASTAATITDCTDLLMKASVNWAFERGLVFTALQSGRAPTSEEERQIGIRRREGSQVIAHFREHAGSDLLRSDAAGFVDRMLSAYAAVEELRREAAGHIDRSPDKAAAKAEVWFASMTELIMAARQLSFALRDKVDRDSDLVRAMRARAAAWDLSEFAGRERGLISGIIAAGRPATAEELEQIGHYRGRIESVLLVVDRIGEAQGLDPEFVDALRRVQKAYRDELARQRRELQSLLVDRSVRPAAARPWFDATTAVIAEAVELQRVASLVSQKQASRLSAQSLVGAQMEFLMLIAATLLGAAGLMFVTYRVVRPIERVTLAFDRLAAGDGDIEIPASAHRDEIGIMTQAILAFRETMIERRHLEEEVHTRRRIEVELRKAKEEAESANHAKSRFLANVSHELRTPLNAVIGFAEALERGYIGPLGDRQRGYIADIRRSGKHLLDLIEDVLDISKAESEDWEIADDPVLAEVVGGQALSFVAGLAQRRGVTLRGDIPAMGLAFRGDRRMVVQMLTNLSNNAVKFTPPGGEVRLAASRRDDGGIRFAVSDTGIGMTDKELETAMELFGQVHKEGNQADDGTGLGLPLVQKLAALHGAELSLRSTPDVGTTALLDFPPWRSLHD
ncbi:histidine kinase dimerization/phospho-acceptor domain-containing protein [Pelagibius sp. CAU 1746]|uniref:sensor histidine kinase n=1 Tax=Pelagibius sp. CAU 1746 TaxID=3140370 RepID=UPI00325B1DF4